MLVKQTKKVQLHVDLYCIQIWPKLQQFEISDLILQEIRTEDLACDWLHVIVNLGMVNAHIAHVHDQLLCESENVR